MNSIHLKIRYLTLSLTASILVHVLALSILGWLGPHDYAGPVLMDAFVNIDLKTSRLPIESGPPDAGKPAASLESTPEKKLLEKKDVPALESDEGGKTAAAEEEQKTYAVKPPEASAPHDTIGETTTGGKDMPRKAPIEPSRKTAAIVIDPPLRKAGEFLTPEKEKLSYLISLMGVPVGNVELEAKNENGEVRITLRTKTNTALSSIYPVDDVIETRHLGGNFIITKIRQQEGTFSSDIGFTIFLRDKRVFWFDRMRNRHSNETIPNSEVLDTLSSFYYLRNRPLQTGKTEILHIYDGDSYAPVPVEILRREEIRLRNFNKVDSLVLRHVKQKEIFRRTGDMLIWLTNDENKVPVKMETTTMLGKVTVELVSAETQYTDRPETQK